METKDKECEIKYKKWKKIVAVSGVIASLMIAFALTDIWRLNHIGDSYLHVSIDVFILIVAIALFGVISLTVGFMAELEREALRESKKTIRYYKKGEGLLGGMVKCAGCGKDHDVSKERCPDCDAENPDYGNWLMDRIATGFVTPGFMR